MAVSILELKMIAESTADVVNEEITRRLGGLVEQVRTISEEITAVRQQVPAGLQGKADAGGSGEGPMLTEAILAAVISRVHSEFGGRVDKLAQKQSALASELASLQRVLKKVGG